MKLYIIRHGQTLANVYYADYAWNNNCPIDAAGRLEAGRTGVFLQAAEDWRDAILTSSPLLRTKQTATIIGKHLGLTPTTDDRLFEVKVGEWSKHPIAEVYDYIESLPADQRYTFRPPGGETWVECGQRLADYIHGLQKRGAKLAVVVSHSAPIQCLIATLLELPFSEWQSIDIPNASVSLLEYNTSWRPDYIAKRT
jgi:broad specificity phosphatase PhoE